MAPIPVGSDHALWIQDFASMALADLVAPDAVFPALRASSKKQVLQELATHAAAILGRDQREIFDTLLQRERLGSTGVGGGIAIPHGRLPALPRLFGAFARLEKPIDFEALDGEPVDLVFLLLAPEAAGADHLKALARVARMLRDPANAERLRASRDGVQMHSLLTVAQTPDAA